MIDAMSFSRKSLAVLFFVVAILLAVGVIGTMGKTACLYENERMERVSIHGRVVKRYIDELDHNLKTTVLLEAGWEVAYHRPDLFGQLEVGDSLAKPSGSISGTVHKTNGTVSSFLLDRSCD